MHFLVSAKIGRGGYQKNQWAKPFDTTRPMVVMRMTENLENRKRVEDQWKSKIKIRWRKDIMKVAFIICNGASREAFDLDKLKPHPTFGCNALYRDWQPTWLVSIDEGITKEILESNFDNERHIVPSEDEQYEPAEYNPNRPRSNAGMNAIAEAIKRGYDKLYVLGMDFLLNDDNYTMSNLFDGTDNYGMDTRATENDQKARCGYLTWFCHQHPDTSFRFVFPSDTKGFRKISAPNVTGCYYDILDSRIDSDDL